MLLFSLSVLESPLDWSSTFDCALSHIRFAVSGRGHMAGRCRPRAEPVCQARTPHWDARWQQGHSCWDMSRLPLLKMGAPRRPPIFFTPLGRKIISAGFVCPSQYACACEKAILSALRVLELCWGQDWPTPVGLDGRRQEAGKKQGWTGGCLLIRLPPLVPVVGVTFSGHHASDS